MVKCEKCGAVMFQWSVPKHKCPAEVVADETVEDVKAVKDVLTLSEHLQIKDEGVIEHTITSQDLVENPDLADAGVEVGESVIIEEVVEPEPVKEVKTPAKKPAKKAATKK